MKMLKQIAWDLGVTLIIVLGTTLDLEAIRVVLWIYTIFLLFTKIGLYFSKRASKNIGEFFIAGRNLPWWIAGTSIVATTFAADTPLAVSGIVRTGGIAGNWFWWNFLLGHMLMTFFYARLWRRANQSR